MYETSKSDSAHRVRVMALCALGGCLLLAGGRVDASGAMSLNLSVDDVFPRIHSNQYLPNDSDRLWLAQASSKTGADKTWQTALPPADKFDWIQTTSGEWLKGSLKVLYSGSLEFDSDEFGLQIIKWDDVAQLRSHDAKRLSIDTPVGPTIFEGVVNVTKSKVVVVTDQGSKEFDRSKLISITPDAENESGNWSAKVSVGAAFSRGNSDQTDFTAKANIKRRTPENRFVIDYLGNYSESEGSETANNHRVNSYFDILAAKEYFWRPVFVEYFRDPFQNIDYRATIGAAVGYNIIDSPKTTWDVTGGPAYRATRYVSVLPGDSQNVSTPALVVSTSYATTLTKTVDFNGLYNFSIVNKESGTYTQHAIGTFEIALTDIFDFDISFVWDRTQDPQARSDGTVPKQNDYQVLFTLGVNI